MIVWQVDLKITYNNMLSYDYKIKLLRDASDSKLFPAVINYRVTNGQRDYYNKINREEARAIVSLMKACIEQPEYEDKTFGVISLLGDEQVKVISSLNEKEIDPKEICQNQMNSYRMEIEIINCYQK